MYTYLRNKTIKVYQHRLSLFMLYLKLVDLAFIKVTIYLDQNMFLMIKFKIICQ